MGSNLDWMISWDTTWVTGRQLEVRFGKRRGNSYLQLDAIEEDPMQQLLGHSITYRVAVGPQQGKKVFTLQTVPATESEGNSQVAQKSGFSLTLWGQALHLTSPFSTFVKCEA
jgi:hypothetical protein